MKRYQIFSLVVCLMVLAGCANGKSKVLESAIPDKIVDGVAVGAKAPAAGESNAKTGEGNGNAKVEDNRGPYDKKSGYSLLKFEGLLECSLENTGSLCEGTKIFPIGWSKDGKFAYFVEYTSEAMGDQYTAFSILDTNNNKLAYLLDDCAKEEDGESHVCMYESKKFLNQHDELINQKLQENGIIKNAGVNLLHSPITSNGKTISPSILNPKNYLKSPFQDRIVSFDISEYPGYEGPPSTLSVDLKGVDLTKLPPSQSPIRDFVYDYIKENTTGSYSVNWAFEHLSVNIINNELLVKIENPLDGPYQNLFCATENIDQDTCLPRGDEPFYREMDDQLKKRFKDVQSVTVYENGKVIFKNNKYFDNHGILGLSKDGRIAEVGLDEINRGYGAPHACFFMDMQSGECLFREDSDFSKKDEDDKQSQFSQLRSKYEISQDIDRTSTFLSNSLKVNDEILIVGEERVTEGDGESCEGNIYCLSQRSSTSIFLVHTPTNSKIEIAIGRFSYTGLFGNPGMSGLFFYTWWYWENQKNFEAFPIPQSLLDQKLSELYNNVGMHYYDQREYETAIGYFDKAVGIKADYAQAIYNKACAQALSGDKDGSVASLEKAIFLDSATFREKAKKDPDFKSLKGNADFENLIK